MWIVILSLYAQSYFAQCQCLCLEGQVTSVCGTVDEARVQALACPEDIACPSYMPGPQSEREYYDAPHEDAHNCRQSHLWMPEHDAYRGVRICNVQPI